MSWGSNMYEEYRNRCKIMQKTYKNNLELYNKYKIIEEMYQYLDRMLQYKGVGL